MFVFKVFAVAVVLAIGLYGAVRCAIDIKPVSEKISVSSFILVITTQLMIAVWQIA